MANNENHNTEEQAVKKWKVRDTHGNVKKSGSLAVVGSVNVEVDSTGGDHPTADSTYQNGQLGITFHDIKGERGNGITSIDVEESPVDGGDNIVHIHCTDDEEVEGTQFRVKNGRRGNGIASVTEETSSEDGGINTHIIHYTDPNVPDSVIHTRNGSQGRPGVDRQPIESGDVMISHVIGNSEDIVMSQMGVKNALTEYSAIQKSTDLTAYPQYNCTPGESTWVFDNEYQKHIVVPVPDGSKSVIINIASGKPFALFYLLASYNTAPTSGATPDCCEGNVVRYRVEPSQNPCEVLLPGNCKYITFSTATSEGNLDLLPESIYFNVATNKILQEGHDAEISVNPSDYPKHKCATGGSSWVYANESQEHIVVPVPVGAKSIVVNAAATNALFYLLKSYTEPTNGSVPDCCEASVTRYEVSQAQSPCEIPLSSTCKYVAFSVSTSNGVNRLPLDVVFRVPANHAAAKNATDITEINDQLCIKSLKEIAVNPETALSGYIRNDGTWSSDSRNSTFNAIQCVEGEKIVIEANENNYAAYAWLAELSTITPLTSASFAAGESKPHLIAAGTTSVLTAPAGAMYLYFTIKESGTDRTPSHIYKLEQKTVKDKVGEIEDDLSKIFVSPLEYEQRPYTTGGNAWVHANNYQKHIIVPVPQGSRKVVIKVEDVSTLFFLLKSYVQPNPRITTPDCCEGSVERHEVTTEMSPCEIELPFTCKYIAFSVGTSGRVADRLPEKVYFIKDAKPIVPYNLYDIDGMDAAYAACRKQDRDFIVKDSYYSYLRILQMTDIHNDVTRLMNAVKIANYMEALFLGTGDYQYLFFTDDSSELLGEFSHANDAMFCLGNHDTALLNAANGSHQAYEKFIAPFAEQYGYEVEMDKTYFYRDFTEYKIRIIALNQFEPYPEKRTTGDECMSQEQITWLLNCLLPYDENDNPNGLKDDFSVIIAMHRPEVAHDFSMGANKFQDCTPSDWFATFRYGTPIYDIIDAFNLKSSLTRTYTNNSIPTTSTMERSFEVDVDFSVNEGRNVEFVGFFCGHTHKDAIYQIPDRASKMWMLDAPATCAQYDDSAALTNFNTVSDLPRQSGTKVENALNFYVIDTDTKRIRIVRIGSQVPYTLDKRRDYMAISYAQEQD